MAVPIAVNEPLVRRLNSHPIVLLVVWSVAVSVLSTIAYWNWHAHDEGLLAHTAERVLGGELPHLGVDAAYTGGLEFLNALAFKLLGIKLTSLRLVALGLSSLWLLAVYACLARALSPVWAGATTLLVFAWSLPVYFTALPSWYVTFCGTFATLGALRYLDTGHRRWLFLAGVAGGVAILLKVVGLFVLVAVGLFVVRVEQDAAASSERPRSRWTTALYLLGAAGITLGLFSLVRTRLGVMDLVLFIVPGAALAIAVAHAEVQHGRGALGYRLGQLWRSLGPVLLGAAVPVGLFLVPYVSAHAVDALVRGVFVLPQRRLTFATVPLPPAWTLVAALPAALLLVWPKGLDRLAPRRVFLALAGLLTAVVLLGWHTTVYQAVWLGLRPLLPLACVAVAVRAGPRGAPEQALFLLASMAAFLGLLQFPFSIGVYFCYASPPLWMALAALAVRAGPSQRAALGAVALFFLAFGALWVAPGQMHLVGKRFERPPELALLDLPRGGLEVHRGEAAGYMKLVRRIQALTPAGSAIYAAPDCPQVYFLSDRRNPTATMYDFFDEDFGGDPAVRRGRILQTLEQADIKLVVLNEVAEFSGPVERSLRQALEERYPSAERHGPFTLRWRP